MHLRPSPRSPEVWVNNIFSSKSAAAGSVIRRKARDIERFCGRDIFAAELRRRGFQAVENAGQVVISCNQEPVRRYK
ncbi:MAG: N-(5'-phosphoribosyl)anthranilate isomerase [Sulfitobacter sp.]